MYTINLTIVQDHNNDKEPSEIHRQIAKYKITNNKHNNNTKVNYFTQNIFITDYIG